MTDILNNFKNKIKSRYFGNHIGHDLYNEHVESEIKKIDRTAQPILKKQKIDKIKSEAKANFIDFKRKGEDIARKNRSHDLGILGTASVLTQVPNLNRKSEINPISNNVQNGLNDVVNK